MAKKKLSANLPALATPAAPPETPPEGRAIDLPTYLQRIMPFYGSPAYLLSAQWRQFVRNQPLAVICRDNLLAGLKSLDWDIVAYDPLESNNRSVRHAISYYKELFAQLDGDFDVHLDLMGQDYLDLPFGGMSEVIREDDDPRGPVLAVEHVDGGTLWPTLDDKYPVMQMVPDVAMAPVAFPKHAINRLLYSPRPELRRKGWGMAPPEKVYLSLEMLYRSDTYYWKLLLDTPEAGILDLIDMTKGSATEWIRGFRELFSGIDGFKVPVLYEHKTPAQWIPFNRPPIEMLYDKTQIYYAQILAAGYGLRISDLGLEEARGAGTLAGVIRGERQSKRSGHGTVKESFRNYFNRLLPQDPYPIIRFTWLERDDEAMVARGRSMLAMGQAFQALIGAGIIDRGEARQEMVALGMMDTEIDPDILPQTQAQAPGGLDILGALLGAGAKNQIADGKDGLEAPPLKSPPKEDGEKTPPSQGGRGDQPQPVGFVRSLAGTLRNVFSGRTRASGVPPGKNPATRDAKDLLAAFDKIVQPGLLQIKEQAEADEAVRVRRLVRVCANAMVPRVAEVFRTIDDDEIESYWLPEMQALTFRQASELDSEVTRQEEDAIEAALEAALTGETWWQTASVFNKQAILEIYTEAFEVGMEDMALDIIRQMYERGLRSSPLLPGISFSLQNPQVQGFLEGRAGNFVTQVSASTKEFIKRIITAGVRQGISSPEIAQAIRDGATAEEVLMAEGFMGETLGAIMDGITDMTASRANSIANYEIAWAENAGRNESMVRNGFSTKAWVHLGERGITEAGNEHPCIICESNEALGFVPIDTLYETVFDASEFPPAHPGVCHCTIVFNPEELTQLVASGEFAPWVGE